jgi:VanZ family protein
MQGCRASVVIFIEVGLLLGALLPILAILGTPFGWGLWILILVVAGVLGLSHAIHENLLLALVVTVYGYALNVAFLSSFSGWTAGAVLLPVYWALLGLSALALFLRFGRADARTRRATTYLVIFIAVASLIALFSGALGGAGRMFWFATQVLGLDDASARSAVVVIRKTVHLLCYGFLGGTLFLASRSSGVSATRALIFAVGLAVAHAVFDESRQTLSPERTGTPADVFLDAAGALIGAGLVAWRDSRHRSRRGEG